MDITTLAAAKAYTDKKVAEGGGSGGGGLPVVNITSITMTDIIGAGEGIPIMISDSEGSAIENARGDVVVVTFNDNAEHPFLIPLLFYRTVIDGELVYFGYHVFNHLFIGYGEGSWFLMRVSAVA